MDPRILTAVKEMKQRGLNDTEIVNNLLPQHSIVEINACLTTLKDMQTGKDIEQNPSVSEIQKQSTHKRSFAKYLLIVLVGVVAFLIFFDPGMYKYIKTRHINDLASTLASNYDVDKYYNAGSATDCVEQGPTRFGEITGLSVCSVVSAKIYYPKVATRTQESLVYTDEEGRSTSVPRANKYLFVEYVNKDGQSLESPNGYIQFGTPIKQPGEDNPYYVEKNLHLGGFDHIVFTGIRYKSQKSSDSIAKNWFWRSEPGWLGSDSPGEKLQKKVDQKINANESPAKGAPTVTAALREGRAPLAVYFTARYCHNPNFVVLDKFCILPD